MSLKLSPPPDPRTDKNSPSWDTWYYTIFSLFGNGNLGNFSVADLPTAPLEGQLAYATNGRKVGEPMAGGTGVPIYYSNGAWRVFSTDTTVNA
jgi:hypothetical protein